MKSSEISSKNDFYAELSAPAVEIFSSIKNSIGQGFCLSNADGIICDVNQEFASQLSYQREEMINHHFSEFLAEKLRPYACTHHQEFMTQPTDNSAETWEYEDKRGGSQMLNVLKSRVKLDEAEYRMDILIPVENASKASFEQEIDGFKQQSRHLFKNTLQEISGLLQLQAAQTQGETRQILMHAQKRETVVALAFEQLYKHENDYEIELTTYLGKVLAIHSLSEEVITEHPALYFELSKGYALGLILSEVLMSSMDKDAGKYSLSGSIERENYRLQLRCEGNFERKPMSGLSPKLVKALKHQLAAEDLKPKDSNVLLDIKIPI